MCLAANGSISALHSASSGALMQTLSPSCQTSRWHSTFRATVTRCLQRTIHYKRRIANFRSLAFLAMRRLRFITRTHRSRSLSLAHLESDRNTLLTVRIPVNGDVLTYALNPLAPPSVKSLTFSPNPVPAYNMTVSATIQTFGTFSSVALTAPRLPAITCTQTSPTTWSATFNSNLLRLGTNGSLSFTATGNRLDGTTSSASGQLILSNTYDYPNSILVLQATDQHGTLRTVDGITCDNSASVPSSLDNDARDFIQIALPAAVSDITASNSMISVRNQAKGTADAGSVSFHTVNGQAYIYYYPPLEFNPTQPPISIQNVVGPPTRNIILSVSWTRNGQTARIDDKTIVVARPITILVHGINSSQYSWRTNYANPGTGFYDSGAQLPIVAVDYSDIQNANGAVEYASYRLNQTIKSQLDAIFGGSFDPSFGVQRSSIFSPFLLRGYTFHWYKPTPNLPGLRLAERRVDIVAWSYGSMVTRWYIASSASTPNVYSNYHWLDRTFDPTWVTKYGNDIRKVVTLGGMWRGVPLANYANEVNFSSGPLSMNEAQTNWSFSGGLGNLGQWLDHVFDPIIQTKYPSMEVMAVNSPWLSYLIYGTQTQNTSGQVPQPFLQTVEYGAIAGEDHIPLCELHRSLLRNG